jgi:cytochrome c553
MKGIGGKYLALAAAAVLLGAGVAAHAQDQTKGAAPAQGAAAQPAAPAAKPAAPATPEAQPAAPATKPVSAAMHRKMEAKFTYCRTCHGVEGQGFRGAFPIPRLAGQQPAYIKNQLDAFIQKRRTNVVMNHVAQVLSPEMEEFLAESFHKLNPPPLGGAPAALIPAGKEIFHHGVPSANVPPCATCHGDDAMGNGEIPRLAGQLNDYIFRKLTNFSAERGLKPSDEDVSSLMKPIAHNLTPTQIKEVAAYVSSLK